jgi:chromosome segregation ATPase
MARLDSILALAFVVAGANAVGRDAASDAVSISPVQKVIQMLEDMRAKGKAEKEDETVLFASYKVFCTKTSEQKKKSITEGKDEIEQLKAEIVKANADAETMAQGIAQHDADLATWGDEKAKMDEVRNKEKADFQAVDKDYADSISSTQRALATLEAQPAAVGQSLVQVDASLRHLQMHPKTSHAAKSMIMMFLQRGRDDGDGAFLQAAAPEAAAFESHTGGVKDMVKDLGDKFEDEKNAAEKAEMEKAAAYQLMVQDILDQIDNAKEAREEKAATKKQRESDAADAKGDLADTQASLADDEQFLKQLETECEQKSVDYEKRQVLRAGEITAVSKAIEIMSSDKVSGGTKHLPGSAAAASLLQLDTAQTSVLQGRVSKFLETRAVRANSRVLELVSAKIQTGDFKKITKMIQDMIDKLMQEALEEAEHKGFCDTEMKTNGQAREQKTTEADALKAEVEQLTADITMLSEQIADLSSAIFDIDAAVAKATAERTEEKEKNTVTIADAKVANEATSNALAVLKEFYDKAAGATALAQTDDDSEKILKAAARGDTALVQQTVDASVPGAPETFDKPYTGMGGANTGVVGMLEVIQSDFARLETETTEAEAEAAGIYKKFMQSSSQAKAIKTTDMKHKQGVKAEKSEKKNSAEKELAITQEELNAALDYFEKLKPSCVDEGISYEDRVLRRKEEIESLKEALEILNGKDVA